MYVKTISKTVTTAADGSADVQTVPVNGRLLSIRYVKTDFDNGVAFVLTNATTGETLWNEGSVNASATRAPRQGTHSYAGAAALYAAGGQAVNDYMALADASIRIVITNGGNAKVGTFHFTFA